MLKSAEGSLTQQLMSIDLASGEVSATTSATACQLHDSMLRAALQVSEVCKPPEGVGEEETLSIEEKLRRGASERPHPISQHLSTPFSVKIPEDVPVLG